jgi:hypothetical protein
MKNGHGQSAGAFENNFLQAYLEIQPFKLPAAVTDPEPHFNDSCRPDFPRPDSRENKSARFVLA